MFKRKNLQSFSNLEPFPKRCKYYGNPFGNTFCNSLKRKRQLSWKDVNFETLLTTINCIEHNDKMNKMIK